MKLALMFVLLLVVLVTVSWWAASLLDAPPAEPDIHLSPTPPPATPEPLPTPQPEPDETPLVVVWCHCASPYGECVTLKRTWTQVALGHENQETHSHDYVGECLTASEEDWQLQRVLHEPPDTFQWAPGVLGPADRAARRQRIGGQ